MCSSRINHSCCSVVWAAVASSDIWNEWIIGHKCVKQPSANLSVHFREFGCNFPQDAVLPVNTWSHNALSSPVLLCFLSQLHSDSSSSETSTRQPTGSFSPASTGHRRLLLPWFSSWAPGICHGFSLSFTSLLFSPTPAGLSSRVRWGSAGEVTWSGLAVCLFGPECVWCWGRAKHTKWKTSCRKVWI